MLNVRRNEKKAGQSTGFRVVDSHKFCEMELLASVGRGISHRAKVLRSAIPLSIPC
jgi:hypothetical protein